MKQKMLEAKDKHDLDYLSELGFEAVPVSNAEMQALKKRVRPRFAVQSFRGLMLFGIGALVGALFFFALLRRETSPVAEVRDEVQKTVLPEENRNEQVVLDTVEVMAENFVNRPVIRQKTKVSEQASETSDALILEPMRINNLPGKELEQQLKFISNSQVFYLHDLKVTNYTILYFQKNQFMGLRGTSAERNGESKPAGSTLKQHATQYLHEEIAQALWYYKHGKYDQAYQGLKLVSTYHEQDVNCDFYMAMCLFHKKLFTKAIPLFERCIDADNNTFYQEALYYKGLALSESGKEDEATATLKRVVDEQGFYAKKAKDLLSR